MGMFDFFTGADISRRLTQAGQQAQQTISQAGQTAGTSIGAAGRGAQAGYQGLVPQAIAPLTTAEQRGQGYLSGGYDAARTALTGGAGQAAGVYSDIPQRFSEAFAPISALGANYSRAGSTALDALGVNGPAGIERASAAYNPSPGLDQATARAVEDVTRAGNARNAGGYGGNTLQAATDAATKLRLDDYNAWRSALGPYAQMGLTGTTAGAAGAAAPAASALMALGGLYAGTGAKEAELATNLGGAQTGLASGLGTGSSNLISGLGQAGIGADLNSQLAAAQAVNQGATGGAQALLQQQNNAAQAEGQARSNLMSLIGQGINAGAAIMTGNPALLARGAGGASGAVTSTGPGGRAVGGGNASTGEQFANLSNQGGGGWFNQGFFPTVGNWAANAPGTTGRFLFGPNFSFGGA